MCDALHYLLENVFIRFGSKLYRKIVGIPMGTNCAPLVADFALLCYERDNIGLKTLLQQGISEPIFYGDLVYKFKRIVGKPNFSDQFNFFLSNVI